MFEFEPEEKLKKTNNMKIFLFLTLLFPSVLFANTEADLICLAKNIYFEAGNQSIKGKQAVAAVTMNRVKSKRFPNSVCEVVMQAKTDNRGNPKRYKCQYSWYCDGKKDTVELFKGKDFDKIAHEAYMESVKVAIKYINGNGIDVTNGADHYHSFKVSPFWADSNKITTQIQSHIFYKLHR